MSTPQQVAEDLLYLMAHGTPAPKPLRVITRISLPPPRMSTGEEQPVFVEHETRELYPVYFRHPMAVYEVREGLYSVMRNGSGWGRPFETADLDLAVMVCDRWAREFTAG